MNSITPPAPIALSSYEQSAIDFLAKHGIAFRAVLSKTQKAPAWVKEGSPHGLRYQIQLRNGPKSVTFPFWDSISAKEKGKTPSAYSVLACISGDVHCPETFADFCADYGYDEDSRAALATFKRCSALAKKLRAFFSEAEIEGLSEIQ